MSTFRKSIADILKVHFRLKCKGTRFSETFKVATRGCLTLSGVSAFLVISCFDFRFVFCRVTISGTHLSVLPPVGN